MADKYLVCSGQLVTIGKLKNFCVEAFQSNFCFFRKKRSFQRIAFQIYLKTRMHENFLPMLQVKDYGCHLERK